MCRLLLNHGCSVNFLSHTGESPLHILTKKGRFEAAMVLLTHEANANLKGQDGNTALHLAMKVCVHHILLFFVFQLKQHNIPIIKVVMTWKRIFKKSSAKELQHSVSKKGKALKNYKSLKCPVNLDIRLHHTSINQTVLVLCNSQHAVTER